MEFEAVIPPKLLTASVLLEAARRVIRVLVNFIFA
jgi:hypothetical protein